MQEDATVEIPKRAWLVRPETTLLAATMHSPQKVLHRKDGGQKYEDVVWKTVLGHLKGSWKDWGFTCGRVFAWHIRDPAFGPLTAYIQGARVIEGLNNKWKLRQCF